MKQDIAFIGIGSGWGARDMGTGKGPHTLLNSVDPEVSSKQTFSSFSPYNALLKNFHDFENFMPLFPLDKEASLIRKSSVGDSFHGFIEGDDITKGTVDVVVTDGFTGNIVLKAGEGVMQMAMTYVREGFKNSLFAGLGYLLARPMLEKLKARLDHRRYNGGIWLGLNGIAIKSHGGTDALGFSHAIALAIDMVTSGVNDHIREEFKVEGATQISQKKKAVK